MHKIEPESYFEALNRACQKANERIVRYISSPSEENVHDARTAIRRLDTAFRVLPKNLRKKPKVRDFVSAHKEFFRTNSQIRDFDIILSKLDSDKAIAEIINKKKKKRIDKAQEQAERAASLEIPKIRPENIHGAKLEKKFNKISFGLIERIQTLMPQVVKDENNVKELHELRKDCKKLRYLLEMGDDSEASSLIKHLKHIQDSLGAIHDSDITVDFLKKLPTKYKPDEIIKSESDLRALLYQKFAQEHRLFTSV